MNPEYLTGYAIGYYYGREHGDREPGHVEMTERFGVSGPDNISHYTGFGMGYQDGVDDYICATETGWDDAVDRRESTP